MKKIIFDKNRYKDRESKAQYIFDTYSDDLVNKKILNIGSGQGLVKKCLPNNSNYFEVDAFGHPDLIINLEEQLPLPFEGQSYDTVICTDVLEHLDNLHDVLEEIFRISKNNLIISLPNCYNSFYQGIFTKQKKPLKYYGLPNEKPNDRHKWFFSSTDIMNFFENYKSDEIRELQFRLLNVRSREKSLKNFFRILLRIILGKYSTNFLCTTVFIKIVKK